MMNRQDHPSFLSELRVLRVEDKDGAIWSRWHSRHDSGWSLKKCPKNVYRPSSVNSTSSLIWSYGPVIEEKRVSELPVGS